MKARHTYGICYRKDLFKIAPMQVDGCRIPREKGCAKVVILCPDFFNTFFSYFPIHPFKGVNNERFVMKTWRQIADFGGKYLQPKFRYKNCIVSNERLKR